MLEDSLLLRVAAWLMETALFEQAWSAVCVGPLNWWWSEQLCLFTAGAFTVFLFVQRKFRAGYCIMPLNYVSFLKEEEYHMYGHTCFLGRWWPSQSPGLCSMLHLF